MYGDFNSNGTVNRLPKVKTETTPATFGKNIGGTMIQAVVLVAAIKLVDVVIEVAMARFRKPRQPNRREEHPVGV